MIHRIDNPLDRTMELSRETLKALDSSLPPIVREHLERSRGVGILVFTHDAELANLIRSVSGAKLFTRVVNEWRDLLTHVAADHSRIIVLDVDALTLSVEEALAELNNRAQWLVIVIAAKQSQAQNFMSFWSERRIHRLLIKPAAVGITRLLLESAIGRYLELKALDEAAVDELSAAGAEPTPPTRRRSPLVKIALTLIVLAAAAVAAIRQYPELVPSEIDFAELGSAIRRAIRLDDTGSGTPQSRAEPIESIDDSRPAPAPRPGPDEFAGQLASAEAALAAGRLAEPGGALDQYLAIVDVAPDHPTATIELAKLVDRLYSRAEAILVGGDLDSAAAILTQMARALPEDSRRRGLEEQLARARVDVD